MINKIFLFITVSLSLSLFSCNSQNTSSSILGNWVYSASSTESKNFYYVEIYIDNKYFHIYHEELGPQMSTSYTIKDSLIYFEDNLVGKMKIAEDGNHFEIKTNSNKKISYEKIKDEGTLDKLLKNEISENKFFIHFQSRMKKWKAQAKKTE